MHLRGLSAYLTTWFSLSSPGHIVPRLRDKALAWWRLFESKSKGLALYNQIRPAGKFFGHERWSCRAGEVERRVGIVPMQVRMMKLVDGGRTECRSVEAICSGEDGFGS